MATKENINVVSPQAYALIFNYSDRGASINDKTTETGVKKLSTTYINTLSLISVSTTKPKGTPSGSFEMVLAPTRNWLTMITPGSWVAIAMTRDSTIGAISNTGTTVNGSADKKSLKMFGRIDTVTVDVSVDQATGARSTTYVVRGRDWGSVFDTSLYVDPLYLSSFKKSKSITTQTLVLGANKAGSPFFYTTDLIKSIVQFWGAPLEAFAASQGADNLKEMSSNAQFILPLEAAKYMFGSSNKNTLSKLITVIPGKLDGYDKYTEVKESGGLIDINSLFGNNTFWQVLNDNCNNTINELVTDLRWDGDSPTLALYKRIKPFGNRNTLPSDASSVQDIYSKFRHVKTTGIPLGDVISINASTDFNDKINFIELMPKFVGLKRIGSMTLISKDNARIVDPFAYARDGFKPMFAAPNFYNTKQGIAPTLVKETTEWKFLLREWYFNLHTLLKGTMSFIGQNDYIAVGDNIRVNSVVLGHSPMTKATDRPKPTYMTAHIEGVSHSFTIDQNTGARKFITTVSFVRGVMTDEKSVPLSGSYSALDSEAVGTVNGKGDGRFNSNTVSTSLGFDPDEQKKRGN